MTTHLSADYRFLIPRTHSSPVGTEGEMASSIPYVLEPDITPESIRRELARLPHMHQLAGLLDAQRRIYLLYSTSQEQLELAAQYIGTFHRLQQEDSGSLWDVFPDDADPDPPGTTRMTCLTPDSSGDCSFDFRSELPCVDGYEVVQIYGSGSFFGGMGGFGLHAPAAEPQDPLVAAQHSGAAGHPVGRRQLPGADAVAPEHTGAAGVCGGAVAGQSAERSLHPGGGTRLRPHLRHRGSGLRTGDGGDRH